MNLTFSNHSSPLFALRLRCCSSSPPALHAQERWTEAQANAWYAQQPWPVGANFLPSTAINQLEMWQAESFDPATIDRELGWAEGIGMNTMRVFLHNLLWEQDPKGFQHRIDAFLTIAARHHIRPIFVLFDSCWDPFPKLGPQHPPIPGVHNSGWVQAPGVVILSDPAQYPRLESYVKGVVGAFANDPRILAWDLWNEPDNGNDDSYAKASRKTRTRSSSACCRRSLPGPAPRTPRSPSPAACGTATGLRLPPCRHWPASRSSSPTSSASTTTAGPRTSSSTSRCWSSSTARILCTEYMARNLAAPSTLCSPSPASTM